MSEFIALLWRAEDPDAVRHAQGLCARLDGQGHWERRKGVEGCALWTRRGRRLPVTRSAAGRALLVGRLHAPIGEPGLPQTYVAAVLDDTPAVASRRLTGAGWGSYVALFPSRDDGPWAYRDPSGALEAFAWACAPGLHVVASGVEGLPAGWMPPRIALNWARIGRILRQPGRTAMECPLDGIEVLLAGRATPLDRAAGAAAVWTPAAFVRGVRCDAVEAARELERRVDGAVAEMASAHRTLVAELSGGLDSAIVASSLVRAGLASRTAAWVNYYGARREGDERAYARAMAERIGVPLTEVPLTVEPVCEADYAGLARGVRPPMSALGRLYDRDMAERATALGADAIVTGQGGDAAFFQMPTAHLLADALRLGGPRALFSGVWGDTARWTGRPAWRVLADLWRRAAPMEPPPLLPGLDPEVGLSVHPWVEEAAQAPPAKRLQVAALAGAQVYPGDSSRRRAAEVLRPLLSQPVLEHVLAIPAPQLAEGGRDRALTRQAFAGRLPAEIVARRAKGGLGAYYGQVVVASLHWLRPYLLDGVLCDSGLLDRARLEAGLGPAQLIWEGSSVDILAAALMETWVRYWQARIPDSAASPRPRLE